MVGSSDPITGRVKVMQLAVQAAATYAAIDQPATMAPAVAAIATACAVYPAASARSGLNRSPA